ncbi:MAG: hypothetical protein C0397_02340 [Odoribacter sp.]|nr:hypothetical protein [Odoribacter sp.]
MKTNLLNKSESLIGKQVRTNTTLGDKFEGVLSSIKAKGNVIYYFLSDLEGKEIGIPDTTIIDIEELH